MPHGLWPGNGFLGKIHAVCYRSKQKMVKNVNFGHGWRKCGPVEKGALVPFQVSCSCALPGDIRRL